MVDLELLALRARRVAERSRARMALRIALPIGVLTAVPVTQHGSFVACLLAGLLLLAAAAALRWRSQEGVRATWHGLVMGTIPIVALLFAPVCSSWCLSFGGWTEGELLCVAGGALAGAGVSIVAARGRRGWSMALAIASLTATLACVPLGAASLAVTLVPLAAASLVVRASWRFRPA